MDRFQQMSVFVAVAEERGFAAAARRLHMSPPAVTRSVAALGGRSRWARGHGPRRWPSRSVAGSFARADGVAGRPQLPRKKERELAAVSGVVPSSRPHVSMATAPFAGATQSYQMSFSMVRMHVSSGGPGQSNVTGVWARTLHWPPGQSVA